MRASALRRLMRRAHPTAASVQAVCSGRRAPHAALPPAGRCGVAGRSVAARSPSAAAAERLPPPLRASVPVPRALAAASQRSLRTRAVAEPAPAAGAAAPVDFSLIELPTSDESDALLRIRHTVRPRSAQQARPRPAALRRRARTALDAPTSRRACIGVRRSRASGRAAALTCTRPACAERARARHGRAKAVSQGAGHHRPLVRRLRPQLHARAARACVSAPPPAWRP